MVARSLTSRFAVGHLPDAEVLARLALLVARDRQVTAELLAHLAEVDARKLYLEAACSSTFGYCVERLRFSEPAAYKRVRAARAARAFPLIFDLLARGEVHLAAVTLLAPYLTAANHRELLAAAAHKSKREVEELVAARFPTADVPDLVRRMPPPPAAATVAPVPALATGPPAAAIATFAPAATGPGIATSAPAMTGPASATSAPAATGPGIATSAPAAPALSTAPPSTPASSRPPPVVAPLASDRYRVQFTATRQVHDRLREAQDLLRRDLPDGDLNAIIGRALDLLVRDLRRKRFAATPRPRTTVTDAEGTRRSAHIPNAVKRAVVARDGGQCSYIDAQGRRCQERGRLEFHHCEPQGQGGVHRVATITLRCHRHHALATVGTYGAVRVARAIAARRGRAELARTLTPPAQPPAAPPPRLAPGPVPTGTSGPGPPVAPA